MSNMMQQFVARTNDGLLGNIGAGIAQIGQQVKDKRAMTDYQDLLGTAMEDGSQASWIAAMNAAPTEEARADSIRSYQITENERQRIEAARIKAEQVAKYSAAKTAYMEEPTRETLGAMYESSGPLGIFDQTVKTVEGMDSLQQTQQLQQLGEYYSMGYSGNTEALVNKLESDILAYEADGEMEEAQGLKEMLSQLKEEGFEPVGARIGSNMGIFDGGIEMMENIHGMNAEIRAERDQAREDVKLGLDVEAGELSREQFESDAEFEAAKLELAKEKHESDQIMTSAKIFEIMEGLSVENPEERARLGEVMDGMPLSYGKKLSELIQIGGIDTKDMTATQFSTLVDKLRKEYTKDTEGFRANDAVKDKMNASLAQDTSQGDVGSLFLFMKMLDENSVVRESEFKTASNMGSVVDSFRNIMDGWVTGQRLQPNQKKNLEKLTSEFYRIAEEKRQPIDDRMRKNTSFFRVPEGLVFLDYDGEETPNEPAAKTVETVYVPSTVTEEEKTKAADNITEVLDLFSE